MKASDEQIVSALMSTRTNAEAAAACGLSTRQLITRMQAPELQALLTDAKSKVLERATESAQAAMVNAVDVMREIMQDTEHAPQVRLNAADAILRNGLRLTDVVDVQRRLAALEERFGDDNEKQACATGTDCGSGAR